jgi:tetratricopeptide (TPR) repeat protein
MKKMACIWVGVFFGLSILLPGGAKSQVASSSDLSALEKELVALEDKWTEAFIKHDPAPLSAIIADEYILIRMDGRVNTKTTIIDKVKDKDYELYSFPIMDTKVQLYGNVAILRGMANDKGKENGKEYEDVIRFIDVWVKRDGRWQCVAGQNFPAEKEIPLTTSSTKARELFIQGRQASYDAGASVMTELLYQSIAKDSTFALAYALLALSTGSPQIIRANFAKAQAFASKATKGEQILIDYYQASVDADGPKRLDCINKLLAMYPGDKWVQLEAGYYYRSIDDKKTSLEHFSKATNIDKEFTPAYNILGYLHMENYNFPEAEKAFKEYIRLVPTAPNPYDSYGEMLRKMGRFDESIIQYQKAYDIDNEFIISLLSIGDNYLFKGDYAKAREYYQKYFAQATQAADKMNALYFKALSFLYEGKLDEALKGFEERRSLAEKAKEIDYVIQSSVDEGFVLTEMGKPLDGLKNYQKAITLIEKADLPGRDKENWRFYSKHWLAYANTANGILDKAEVNMGLFKRDVDRRGNPMETFWLQDLQAFLDLKEKKYNAAVEGFSKTRPNPWVLFYQAQAELLKGDKEAAKGLFKKVVDWNQNSLNLAVVWNRAQKELKKLVE